MIQYIIIIIEFIIIIYSVNTLKRINVTNRSKNNNHNTYKIKPLMTNYEYNFYNIIKPLENNFIIVPQLNLASVIKKTNNDKYYSELFRNIDFAIFTKDYQKLLLLIEINDISHNNPNRKERDLKVRNICQNANINLITFYTNKPNEPNYVINRILSEIAKNNN